jgi:hypothetical protein
VSIEKQARRWTAVIDGALAVTVTVQLDAGGRPEAVELDAGPPDPHASQGSPWTHEAHVAFRDLGRSITVGIRNGVPLFAYAKGLADARFAPCGRTDDPLVPMCRSAVDYAARSLGARFPGPTS